MTSPSLYLLFGTPSPMQRRTENISKQILDIHDILHTVTSPRLLQADSVWDVEGPKVMAGIGDRSLYFYFLLSSICFPGVFLIVVTRDEGTTRALWKNSPFWMSIDNRQDFVVKSLRRKDVR